ncbi:uncharacterized protein LOC124471343 isoform X6 [Hypomesus transpacificus]|uniref:uncharacterized protein LOC124471343 isoform X5 n=1 Tax=Hypomesus transpacificus TaxID=137520 RepID=UPI001F083C31|nr:uncharacterized protein LOC124471343 isoform X5 [Hypomesus transpacificus]XP_046881786.1 uncharacterized protein LOC124471343 isoform X6 [Hypomesus transpacificus]
MTVLNLFLVDRMDCSRVPTDGQKSRLTQAGLGFARNKLVNLTWDLREFYAFVCGSFPSVNLNLIGFTVAKANKQRRLMTLHANSLKDLKRQLRKSHLYIIPRGNLLSGSQMSAAVVNPSTTPAQSSQMSAAALMENSLERDMSFQLETLDPLEWQNAGTPDVFYKIPTSSAVDASQIVDRNDFMLAENDEDNDSSDHDSSGHDTNDENNFTTVSLLHAMDEDLNLATVLKCFQKQHFCQDEEDSQSSSSDSGNDLHVIVHRRKVLYSAFKAMSSPSFCWKKSPKVEFVGEEGADYGGPQREFFRLLMQDVQQSGVFEGPSKELLFTYHQGQEQKYLKSCKHHQTIHRWIELMGEFVGCGESQLCCLPASLHRHVRPSYSPIPQVTLQCQLQYQGHQPTRAGRGHHLQLGGVSQDGRRQSSRCHF